MQRIAIVAWAVLLCIFSTVQADFINGSVQVSSGAFAKVVKAAKLVLAKFDDVYPYGDKMDEYKKIAAASRLVDDWLCVEIGVADYGEKDNSELGERYSVKKDDFPVYYLFKNGDLENPVRHKGSFKADDVKAFVAREGGIYIGLSGCIETFDKFAMAFVRESDEVKRKAILQEAQTAAAKLKATQKESADFYLKVMQKHLENPNFVKDEVARITKLKEGKVSDNKREQMNIRLNILTAFVNGELKNSKEKEEL